ncbi:MAG: WG repeat-containing protein [Sphingobacteriales bacterium]|nr:WG repeat-containing protein [Sphingobacteriales bacterium]
MQPTFSIRDNDITLFVGYVPQDTERSEKLLNQLAFFKKRTRKLPIDIIFESSLVMPDDEVAPTIKKALEKAEIVLLLISDNYVNSDFYYDNQLLLALDLYQKGEIKLVPIIVDFCLWDELPIADLVVLPDPQETEATKKRPISSNQWQSEDEPYFLIARHIRDLVMQLETAYQDAQTQAAIKIENENKNNENNNTTNQPFEPTAGAEPDPEDIPEDTNKDDEGLNIPANLPPPVPNKTIDIDKEFESVIKSTSTIKSDVFDELFKNNDLLQDMQNNEKTPRNRGFSPANLPLNEAVYCSKYYDFNQGIAIGIKNGEWVFWNTKGEAMPANTYDQGMETQHNMARVRQNDKWGWIDQNGNEIIPLQYDDTRVFGTNGLAKVKKDGLWGWINQSGEEIIALQYENTYNFANGLALVKKNNKWGWINEQGETVIDMLYETAYLFENGKALVELNNKWGWINKQGETVIPFIYDFAHDFSNNMAMVMQNELWGYINPNGEMTIPMQYTDAQWFEDGVAEVEQNNQRFLINLKGEKVDY